MEPGIVINQTQKWIADVVIGCNFCPFAAREFKRKSIHYEVLQDAGASQALEQLLQECRRLDTQEHIETSLLILPGAFDNFYDYLDLVAKAETWIRKYNYEGVYQVASFHPQYRFAGSDEQDPANYTNRSPYPMLHVLREASIESVLMKYTDPENIPEKNMAFAREKGLLYMKTLLHACL